MNLIKTKSFFSYIAYSVKQNKSEYVAATIDIFILLATLINWQKLTEEKSLILLLATIFVDYLWQLYNIFMHFREMLKVANYKKAESSIVSKEELGNTLTKDMMQQYCDIPNYPQCYMPKDSSFIDSNEPINISIVNKNSSEIEDYVHSMWSILSIFLNEEYHSVENFSNEDKLCMLSEIAGGHGSPLGVKLCKGNYYNSYLTNTIYNKKLTEKDTGLSLYPPMNPRVYKIPLLENSKLSNHIGVSTLLVTSDYKTYLLVQNSKTVQNSDRLVPTGSGSVDFKDASGLTDLRKIVTRAAERELKEETTVDADLLRHAGVNVKTTIIGFYRDLTRGGKPEFCCMTEIAAESTSQIFDVRPQVNEQYTGKREIITLKDLFDGKINNENSPSDTLMINIFFLAQYKARHTKTNNIC